MEITDGRPWRAASEMANSMPSRTPAVEPVPSVQVRTCTVTISAPLATPKSVAAALPPTCVPWVLVQP